MVVKYFKIKYETYVFLQRK